MLIPQMDIRQVLFSYRSYIPIPFVIAMLIFAKPTLWSVIVGIAIVLVGETIRVWGVSYTGSETRTTGSVGGSRLVTSGPFAYVRNPLYIGNILTYAGFGVMSLAVFPWLLIGAVFFFVVQYYLIIRAEEEYLANAFPEQYRDYSEHVPRFIPNLRPYPHSKQPVTECKVKEGLESEKRTLQALGFLTILLLAIWYLRV